MQTAKGDREIGSRLLRSLLAIAVGLAMVAGNLAFTALAKPARASAPQAATRTFAESQAPARAVSPGGTVWKRAASVTFGGSPIGPLAVLAEALIVAFYGMRAMARFFDGLAQPSRS